MQRKGLHVTLDNLARTSDALRAQSSTFRTLFAQLTESEFIRSQRTLSRSVLGQRQAPPPPPTRLAAE